MHRLYRPPHYQRDGPKNAMDIRGRPTTRHHQNQHAEIKKGGKEDYVEPK